MTVFVEVQARNENKQKLKSFNINSYKFFKYPILQE
jgi:hypothetical protein